jgi:hypothetical protein
MSKHGNPEKNERYRSMGKTDRRANLEKRASAQLCCSGYTEMMFRFVTQTMQDLPARNGQICSFWGRCVNPHDRNIMNDRWMIHLDHVGHGLASHIQETLENKKITAYNTKNDKRYIFWLDGMYHSVSIDPSIFYFSSRTKCVVDPDQGIPDRL